PRCGSIQSATATYLVLALNHRISMLLAIAALVTVLAAARPSAPAGQPTTATSAPTSPSAQEPPAASAHTYAYVHHPVSTDNTQAQFAFDRGLTLVFAYQPDEAQQ